MNEKTKKLTILAMLCALAYLIMVVIRIPVVLFLKYDPKDVIITIGGFIFGPMASFIISVLVSFLEMFTVSDTGFIGCFMNILATCSFACTAAFIYKKKHSISGAVIGLIIGWLAMTVVMLLWNYFISPFYMGFSREAVAKLLLPAFLPFNLLKGGLNTALTILLYKPVVNALRRANLIQKSVSETKKRGNNPALMVVSGLVLITCILLVMVKQGVF